MPIIYTCPICGDDALARDASAKWDVAAQVWTLSGLQDGMTCEACGADEIGADQVEIPAIASAAEFLVSPVRADGAEFFVCAPDQAERWGVYMSREARGAVEHIVDKASRAAAVDLAAQLAQGRPIYAADATNGRRQISSE